MRIIRRRLKQQEKIPFGKFAVGTLLAVVFFDCLAFVHAGLSAANLLLSAALCIVYFKKISTARSRNVNIIMIYQSNMLFESAYPDGL
jgi:hypothetical protein